MLLLFLLIYNICALLHCSKLKLFVEIIDNSFSPKTLQMLANICQHWTHFWLSIPRINLAQRCRARSLWPLQLCGLWWCCDFRTRRSASCTSSIHWSAAEWNCMLLLLLPNKSSRKRKTEFYGIACCCCWRRMKSPRKGKTEFYWVYQNCTPPDTAI